MLGEGGWVDFPQRLDGPFGQLPIGAPERGRDGADVECDVCDLEVVECRCRRDAHVPIRVAEEIGDTAGDVCEFKWMEFAECGRCSEADERFWVFEHVDDGVGVLC